jgi:hypothetical protein
MKTGTLALSILVASLAAGTAANAATFTVTNVDATGPGSLHQAIVDANGNEGPDEIVFDIPEEQCSAAGVCAIETALPAITEAVVIDGTTQPRYGTAPANVCATETEPSSMRIEIDGVGNTLFQIDSAEPTTIRGLSLVGGRTTFPISIEASGAHRVQCNHLNLAAAGSSVGIASSSYGVAISGSAEGAIVGTDGDGVDDLAERNVFGPADVAMVHVNANDANVIAGNWFGLEADGVTPAPSANPAVHIRQFSAGNRVGSNQDGVSDELERNVIANSSVGVLLELRNFNSQDNRIVGNWIGLDAKGRPAGNDTGVRLTGFQSVGDDNQGIRANRIAYNGTGVRIEESLSLASSSDNCVDDNEVGVEHAGSDDVLFAGNWWGDPSGPAGLGGGDGDPALATGAGSLTVAPWRTTPPRGVCQQNLLVGGDFDNDRAGWPSTVGSFDPAVDWLDAPDSGSLRIDNDVAGPQSGTGPRQCVAIAPGREYDLRAWIRVPPEQGVAGAASARVVWYDGSEPPCNAGLIGSVLVAGPAPETGAFEPVERLSLTAPVDARLAGVFLIVNKTDAGGLYQAWFDHVEFVPEPGSTAAGAAALLTLAALRRRRGRSLRSFVTPGARPRLLETSRPA